MRIPTLCPLLLLLGCTSPAPTAPIGPRPEVPLVERLAAGTAFRTSLQDPVPEDPRWRAADVWWREALRQSAVFSLRDGEGAANVSLDLVLAIDPQAKSLAAFLQHRNGPRHVLAGASFANGDLPAAIDGLAWRVRLALGEDAAPPVPTAACVSASPEVALAIHDAALLLRDGGVAAAHRALLAARRTDGAAPPVLAGLAEVALLRGEAAAAERLCREALEYENRLSPMTQHRLARTLLLAQASLHPDQAAEHDRRLLQLAATGRRERPHDLQMLLTAALAHNFLAEFAAARPLLEQLRAAEPDQPIVAYHLGWACLGLGDAKAAVEHFAAAAQRLPMPWIALPRAIAIFQTGDLAALAALLEDLRDEVRGEHDPVVHEIRRMQAATAVLQGDAEAAKRHILADLQWLATNPTVLDRRAGEFAEQATVFVRLGGGDELLPLLAAVQAQHGSTAIADACAFVGGLVAVRTSRERATALEGRLARGGESAWSALLAAWAHEVRGEIQDMQTALGRAVRLADSPLTKALLGRALRAAGKTAEARTLHTALCAEMATIRLRRAPQHPVLGPELAFAWRGDA